MLLKMFYELKLNIVVFHIFSFDLSVFLFQEDFTCIEN